MFRRQSFAFFLWFPLALITASPIQERADRFLKLTNAGYQALFRVNSEAQWAAVTDVMPERPWTSASQLDCTSLPTGVMAPMPVTTTLRFDSASDIRGSIPPSSQPSRDIRAVSLARHRELALRHTEC